MNRRNLIRGAIGAMGAAAAGLGLRKRPNAEDPVGDRAPATARLHPQATGSWRMRWSDDDEWRDIERNEAAGIAGGDDLAIELGMTHAVFPHDVDGSVFREDGWTIQHDRGQLMTPEGRVLAVSFWTTDGGAA